MRHGRRLAVDVGKARIGLAVSDDSGLLASPFATVARKQTLHESITDVLTAVQAFEVLEIYVGLPLKMNGEYSPSTTDAIEFGKALAASSSCDVRFIDERMTTKSAAQNLRNHGKNAKNSREVVDQEAAAIILESALNQEKLNGHTPGKPCSEF